MNWCKIGFHDYEVIQEVTSNDTAYLPTSKNMNIRFESGASFKLKICRKCNKVDKDGVNWNILTDEFLQNKIRENNLKKIIK